MSDFSNNDFQNGLDTVSGVDTVKSGKKKGLIIGGVSAGVVAAVVGGGAIAYNLSDTVKNKVKLTFSKPEAYYAWVVENTSDDFSKEVEEAYKKALDTSSKGTKSVVELKYEPSDDVKSLIKDELGDGDGDEMAEEVLNVIDNLKSVGIGVDTAVKGSSEKFGVFASVNDEKLISLEAGIDMKDMLVFARVPELSEKWIGVDCGEILDSEGAADSLTASNKLLEYADDPEKFISPEELGELVKRYTEPLANFTGDIDLEKKDEIEIGDIDVQCSVVTLELNQKNGLKLAKEYLKLLKSDKTIQGIVTDKLGDVTDLDKDEYKEYIEDAISSVDSMLDGELSKNKVDVDVYVDSKGRICGFNIDEDEVKIFMACGRNKGELAFECSIDADGDNMSVVFNGETDGKTTDGELTFESDMDGEKMEASVEIKGFEIVDKELGYFNADIKIIVDEIDPIALKFKTDGKKQDISYKIAIDDKDYGTVTMSLAAERDVKVELPNKSDALMIDENFDISSLEDYATLDDVEDLFYNIAKKLGLSEETSDQLAVLITDMIEGSASGSNGYDWDDDDYDWDDDDYSWDDDDFNWDDDDYSWDDSDFNWGNESSDNSLDDSDYNFNWGENGVASSFGENQGTMNN